MSPSSLPAFRTAALLGFLGVALGAFGAHGLEQVFAEQPKAAHWWETAVFYHLIHTVVLLALACLRPFPALAWRFFTAGIVLFSGSLYLLALTHAHWLVYVTPVGGLCLLAGWGLLLMRPAGSGNSTQNPL